MSQDPDESGLVPDDHLLVRPYVGPSGPPPRSAAPAWPQTGPLAFPGPVRGPRPGGPATAPAPAATPAGVRDPRDGASGSRSRSRLPSAVATLLALAAVGALVLLLSGPEPEPPRAGRPPELSLPVLPARSPDTGVSETGPAASARAGASPAAATAKPSGSASAKASEGTGPMPSPSTSAPRPSNAPVTLRMGDKGPEVRALQEMLYGQGFTYVTVTGVFDSQTKRGVSQLQRDRSIKGDPPGVYGPATQAAMR
ncbi:peptidoglycan-binding protein [Streptomyces sp. NPDC005533]|uniref:peptidoglycan-binding domain-containing protein n=1 Tax=Streptomyces sp. NPDC005533 TaxID=3364723 RepID=UPI0036A7B270